MNLKNYFLCAAVGFAAFGVSLGVLDIGRYVQAFFSPSEIKQDSLETLKVEETISSPQVFREETVTEIVSETDENTERKFYADGDYYIIGNKPKGFKDFEILEVITRDYSTISEANDYMGAPIPPKGSVTVKKKFNFTRINIADKQISFETQKKNGISYQFVGEFIEEEAIEIKDQTGEYTDYAVLKGRLKKMRDGKTIAESDVKFAASHGC
jgi:hypothetical protein